MRRIFLPILFIVAAAFPGCDQPFSYSPFEVRIPDHLKATTEKNLARIRNIQIPADSIVKIALLSDPHYHFNDLRAALEEIDRKADVAFIIVAGDLTENGLLKEFELFHQLMQQSSKPWITVIGNHDYLSNGAIIYQQMFGPLNYTLSFDGVRFIMWDNVLWESNRQPDWEWLRSSLAGIDEMQTRTARKVVVSHIPPFDGQLADSAHAFHQLLHVNNVQASVHGHRHEFSSAELFGNGIEYITIGAPDKRSYVELIITPREIRLNQVLF